MPARVCMFVYNNCKYDSRVIREAKTLARAGYDVRIIAVLDKTTEHFEEREGFKIIRVVKDPLHYRLLRGFRHFSLASVLGLFRSVSAIRELFSSPSKLSVWQNLRRVRLRSFVSGFSRRTTWGITAFRETAKIIGGTKIGDYIRDVMKKLSWVFTLGGVTLLLHYAFPYVRRGFYLIVRRPVRKLKRYVYSDIRKPLYRSSHHLAMVFESFVYAQLKRFLMCFHKPFAYLDYYRRALRIVRQEQADFYHAHDLNTLPIAWYAKRRLGGKLIYDSHELYTETTGLSALERWLWRKIEKLLVRDSDLVLTINDSIAQELKRRYKVPKAHVIMNCAETDGVMHRGDLIRRALELPPEDPIILYQGGFSPHRGLENLIEAMRYISCGCLVLMGWGKLEDELRFRARVRSLLGYKVFFLPPVPQDQLLLWTASADLGVIPYQADSLNNYYTLPNKLFEYIVVGLPVAASNLPELRRVVEEYGLGCTFNPDDPADIARVVEYILSEPDRYAFFKCNAQKAAKIFNWHEEGGKLLSLYKQLSERAEF